mgnify:FL=1
MMKKLLLLISLLIFPFVIDAQTKKDDKKENKTKSIKDLTKSSNKIEGLFTIYQLSLIHI